MAPSGAGAILLLFCGNLHVLQAITTTRASLDLLPQHSGPVATDYEEEGPDNAQDSFANTLFGIMKASQTKDQKVLAEIEAEQQWQQQRTAEMQRRRQQLSDHNIMLEKLQNCLQNNKHPELLQTSTSTATSSTSQEQQDLQKIKDQISADKANLDKEMLAHRQDQQTLLQLQSRLNDQATHQSQVSAALAAREAEANKREQALIGREQALLVRQSLNDQKEALLSIREKALADKEAAADVRAKELNTQEDKLQLRLAKINATEEAVRAGDAALDERRKAAQDTEAQNARLKAQEDELLTSLEQRTEALQTKQSELQEREQKVQAGESQLNALMQRLMADEQTVRSMKLNAAGLSQVGLSELSSRATPNNSPPRGTRTP